MHRTLTRYYHTYFDNMEIFACNYRQRTAYSRLNDGKVGDLYDNSRRILSNATLRTTTQTASGRTGQSDRIRLTLSTWRKIPMPKSYCLPLALAAAMLAAAQPAVIPNVPQNLRCEYLTNPEAVDAIPPRLSWQPVSTTRGAVQSAYAILVSKDAA